MTRMEFVQLCHRRAALKLEIVGLKRRGRTCYSICKEVYNLKGSRESVLAQLRTMIEEAIADEALKSRQGNTIH